MTKKGNSTKRVFGFIASHPGCSFQEIAEYMGYEATSPVGYHVRKLLSEGLVTFNPKIHRSLRVK